MTAGIAVAQTPRWRDGSECRARPRRARRALRPIPWNAAMIPRRSREPDDGWRWPSWQDGRYRSSRATSSVAVRRSARCTISSRAGRRSSPSSSPGRRRPAAAHLVVRRDVEHGEGALAKLRRSPGRPRRSPFTVGLEEGQSLAPARRNCPPLLDDERPAHDREQGENCENDLRDRSGGETNRERRWSRLSRWGTKTPSRQR